MTTFHFCCISSTKFFLFDRSSLPHSHSQEQHFHRLSRTCDWCNISNSTNRYAIAYVPRQMPMDANRKSEMQSSIFLDFKHLLYFYISRLIIYISPPRRQKDVAMPINIKGKSEMKSVLYHSAKLCSLIFFTVVFALEHNWQILNVNVSRAGQSTNYAILAATITTFVFLNDF